MCRIYNTIGSLADIQLQLVNYNLDEFHSLRELIDFLDQYEAIHHKLISEHNQLIATEKAALDETISAILANISQKKHQPNSKQNSLFNPCTTKALSYLIQRQKPLTLSLIASKTWSFGLKSG